MRESMRGSGGAPAARGFAPASTARRLRGARRVRVGARSPRTTESIVALSRRGSACAPVAAEGKLLAAPRARAELPAAHEAEPRCTRDAPAARGRAPPHGQTRSSGRIPLRRDVAIELSTPTRRAFSVPAILGLSLVSVFAVACGSSPPESAVVADAGTERQLPSALPTLPTGSTRSRRSIAGPSRSMRTFSPRPAPIDTGRVPGLRLISVTTTRRSLECALPGPVPDGRPSDHARNYVGDLLATASTTVDSVCAQYRRVTRSIMEAGTSASARCASENCTANLKPASSVKLRLTV